MNYDLASKLRDAGFPQRKPNGPEPFNQYVGYGLGFVYPEENGNPSAYAPTLSELIENCLRNPNIPFRLRCGIEVENERIWVVDFDDDFQHRGSTPEEAVANLWLALQDKN